MRVVIDLPGDLHRRVEDLAERAGVTFSAMAVRLIRAGLAVEPDLADGGSGRPGALPGDGPNDGPR